MGDNSKQMSVEERITQKIKSESMLAIVGDEDAILQLATRAINEALFKDRTVSNGNYHTRTLPSPIMEAAINAAKEICAQVVKEELDKMMKNKKVRAALHGAIIKTLPAALAHVMKDEIKTSVENMMEMGVMDLARRVEQHFGIQLPS
jgi:hypothetical protein